MPVPGYNSFSRKGGQGVNCGVPDQPKEWSYGVVHEIEGRIQPFYISFLNCTKRLNSKIRPQVQ